MNDAKQQSPLRVLVVDDNRESAQAFAMLVRIWGHEARTAPNGLDAIDVAHGFVPDVILMDLGMPRMDGWEAARCLREQAGLHDTLFVAVTGLCTDADRQRSREAGFDHHLVKPIDLAELERILMVSA
jgi:CheY-like chemotaxis protein